MNYERRKKLSGKIIKLLSFLCLILGLLAVNFSYIENIDKQELFESGGAYIEREEYIYTPKFKTEEDYIEQVFHVGDVYLESIKIRILEKKKVEDDARLKLMLYQDGEIVKSEEIIKDDFENWDYYEFKIKKTMNEESEYALRIQQVGGFSNKKKKNKNSGSYVIFNAAEHVEENTDYYIYNGERQKGELELIYTYGWDREDQIKFLVLLDVLVLCFVLFVCKKFRYMKISRLIAPFCYYFMPLMAFCMVEVITGNLYGFSFEYYLKNLIIYYAVYYVFLFLFGNFKFVNFVYSTFFVVLGLLYYFVLLFRGRPFMIQDVFATQTAFSVAGTYNYALPVSIVIVILLYLCFNVLLFNVNVRTFGYRKKRRLFLIVVAFVISFRLVATQYNGMLSLINQWDLEYNYSQMGVAVTLLSEIPYIKVEKPDGYSVNAMNEIAEEMQGNKTSTDVITPQNIILIMNESFADLECINEIDTDSELLPYWKSLKENTISGYLSMPVFGSGTSNSEYEVLTGNTMQFMSPGSIAYQMNVKENEHSVVSVLKKQSFDALAFHPYPASNWNRMNVYNLLGFSSFYALDNGWPGEVTNLRCYASDLTTYEELIKKDEEDEGNLFQFLVTMQNHGSYDYEDYTSTVKLNYNSQYPLAEQYLSIMQESDKAFEYLVEYYTNVEVPTMIVMFGDHQPSVEKEFYEELYGKSLQELSFEESQMQYVTPFKIWTNYDIEEQENVRMSSNYFGSYILHTAGMKLPLYNQFLLNLYEDIPIIGIGGICDRNGTWYKWDELPEKYQKLINDYKILQYNNIYDRKNRLDTFFSVE